MDLCYKYHKIKWNSFNLYNTILQCKVADWYKFLFYSIQNEINQLSSSSYRSCSFRIPSSFSSSVLHTEKGIGSYSLDSSCYSMESCYTFYRIFLVDTISNSLSPSSGSFLSSFSSSCSTYLLSLLKLKSSTLSSSDSLIIYFSSIPNKYSGSLPLSSSC